MYVLSLLIFTADHEGSDAEAAFESSTAAPVVDVLSSLLDGAEQTAKSNLPYESLNSSPILFPPSLAFQSKLKSTPLCAAISSLKYDTPAVAFPMLFVKRSLPLVICAPLSNLNTSDVPSSKLSSNALFANSSGIGTSATLISPLFIIPFTRVNSCTISSPSSTTIVTFTLPSASPLYTAYAPASFVVVSIVLPADSILTVAFAFGLSPSDTMPLRITAFSSIAFSNIPMVGFDESAVLCVFAVLIVASSPVFSKRG